uniref:Uncharacterized protein n=1 Tax=Romanomermis culicivorax TaxID=13658 RepID=A0A915LD85_ROMCU
MTDITRDDLAKFLTAIRGWEEDIWHGDLEKIVEEFRYDGYDPAYLGALLKKYADQSKRDLKKDCGTLVMVFANRGANFNKILQRSTGTARETLLELKAAYKILDKPISSYSKIDVTLGRIGSVFTHQVSLVFAITNRQGIANVDTDYPCAMQHPVFGGLIPDRDVVGKQTYNLLYYGYC